MRAGKILYKQESPYQIHFLVTSSQLSYLILQLEHSSSDSRMCVALMLLFDGTGYGPTQPDWCFKVIFSLESKPQFEN